MARPSGLYRIAWGFYLLLSVGGLVGLAAEGRRIGLRLLVDPASWWTDVGLGLLSGGALLALWLVARRRLTAATELEAVLARLLQLVSRPEVVALAVISAVAEEVAFRGALQGAIGWVGAAVIFALLHIGPGRPFRLWSAYALLGGLTFGSLAQTRQALLAPILGHLIVNLVQLRRLADVHRGDTAGLFPDD
jgi:hypothetical protein